MNLKSISSVSAWKLHSTGWNWKLLAGTKKCSVLCKLNVRKKIWKRGRKSSFLMAKTRFWPVISNIWCFLCKIHHNGFPEWLFGRFSSDLWEIACYEWKGASLRSLLRRGKGGECKRVCGFCTRSSRTSGQAVTHRVQILYFWWFFFPHGWKTRSEEHTSELQSP